MGAAELDAFSEAVLFLEVGLDVADPVAMAKHAAKAVKDISLFPRAQAHHGGKITKPGRSSVSRCLLEPEGVADVAAAPLFWFKLELGREGKPPLGIVRPYQKRHAKNLNDALGFLKAPSVFLFRMDVRVVEKSGEIVVFFKKPKDIEGVRCATDVTQHPGLIHLFFIVADFLARVMHWADLRSESFDFKADEVDELKD